MQLLNSNELLYVGQVKKVSQKPATALKIENGWKYMYIALRMILRTLCSGPVMNKHLMTNKREVHIYRLLPPFASKKDSVSSEQL